MSRRRRGSPMRRAGSSGPRGSPAPSGSGSASEVPSATKSSLARPAGNASGGAGEGRRPGRRGSDRSRTQRSRSLGCAQAGRVAGPGRRRPQCSPRPGLARNGFSQARLSAALQHCVIRVLRFACAGGGRAVRGDAYRGRLRRAGCARRRSPRRRSLHQRSARPAEAPPGMQPTHAGHRALLELLQRDPFFVSRSARVKRASALSCWRYCW